MTSYRSVRIACVALLLVAIGSIAGGSNAFADSPTLIIQQSNPLTPGQSVDLSGTGYVANGSVKIDECRTGPFHSTCYDRGTTTALEDGSINTTLTADYLLPDGSPCLTDRCYFRAYDVSASYTPPQAVVTFVASDVDLATTVTDSTDPVVRGDQVTYTVTVKNNGSVDATNVELYANAQNQSSSSLAFDAITGATCSAAPGTLGSGQVCPLGTVPAGQTASADFAVTSPASGTTMSMQSFAWSDDVDPAPTTDNAAVESTAISDSNADLAVTNSVADLGATTVAGKVVAGNTAEYTIVVTNNGPQSASNVSIADVLDSAVLGPSPAMCDVSGTGTCSPGTSFASPLILASLPSGDSHTWIIDAPLKANTLPSHGQLINAATVSSDTPDATPGNDSANANADIDTRADLVPSIVDEAPGNHVAGDPAGFRYTVTVNNNGPSDHAGPYTVAGTLPAKLSFDQGASSPCTGSGTSFTCSGAALTAGSTDTYSVPVQIDPSAPDSTSATCGGGGTVYCTTVSVSTTGTVDPNPPVGDDASVAVPVITQADLVPSIVDAAPGNHVAGDTAGFRYTVKVKNDGFSDNTGGYALAGTLPAKFSFDQTAASTCSGSGTSFTCANGSGLAAGSTDTFSVPVRIAASAPDSTSLTCGSGVVYCTIVSVASNATVDPNPPHGDDAGVAVPVTTKADLVFDSATAAPSPIFANGTASQNTVGFTVKLHNAGPSDARHSTLKLSPALIAHLSNVDWCQVTVSIACGPSDTFTPYNPTNGIDAGQLAPSPTATTLVIRAHAVATDRNGIIHLAQQAFTVSVPGPTIDPTPANNTGSANTIDVDTVPSPVRNVQAVAGNGNAIVTFEPPTNNGGQTVTQYRLTVSPAGGGSPITVLASSPQVLCPNGITTDCYRANVTPLTNGTLYTIDVQAQNAVGLSDVNDGVNPAAEAKVTPSANASASIVAPAAPGTLTTCAIATATSPTCEQYVIPSGTGGVFGALGNLTLGVQGFPATLCGGSPCIGQGGTANNQLAGAQNLGALAGYNDRTKPLKEIITWDVSTILNRYKLLFPCGNLLVLICYPNDVPVYYETSSVLGSFPSKTGTLLNLHFCGYPIVLGGAGNSNYARPRPSPAGPYNGYRDTAGSACIQKMTVLSSSNPAIKGDLQVTINLTSDSDSLSGHH